MEDSGAEGVKEGSHKKGKAFDLKSEEKKKKKIIVIALKNEKKISMARILLQSPSVGSSKEE